MKPDSREWPAWVHLLGIVLVVLALVVSVAVRGIWWGICELRKPE